MVEEMTSTIFDSTPGGSNATQGCVRISHRERKSASKNAWVPGVRESLLSDMQGVLPVHIVKLGLAVAHIYTKVDI